MLFSKINEVIRLLLFSVVILNIGCNTNKINIQDNSDSTTWDFIQTDDFGIRIKPILNREYLIYLAWTVNVHGKTDPEKVARILPSHLINDELTDIKLLSDVLYYSEPLFRNYILNPKYIDYPLIGLSPQQIIEMQKWMCDRYNENMLIELGYLNYNFDQRDEDNFVLEAFIVGQHQGKSTGIKKPKWREKLYLPNFRIPTRSEIESIKDKKEYTNQLVKYPFDSKDFLWIWNEEYLIVNNKNISMTSRSRSNLSKYNYRNIETPKVSKFKINQHPLDEMTLIDESSKFRFLEYLCLGPYGLCPYPEKNSYGQMQFVIVSSDENDNPIISEMINLPTEESSEYKISRIAFSKKIDSKLVDKN